MRWFCAVLVVGFTLGCGFADAPDEGAKAQAEGGNALPWGVNANNANKAKEGDDGWDEDNPLRGLRFKGKFTHNGKSIKPKFCIAGTDPNTKERMMAMAYAKMNAPEEGGWLVVHAIDGPFPDSQTNTLVIDMSNPDRPGEPQEGSKGCGSSKIRKGGSVTDIDRWDGSLKLDCGAIKAKGTVQFEGCAVVDSALGMASASATSTNTITNMQNAYRSAMTKKKKKKRR